MDSAASTVNGVARSCCGCAGSARATSAVASEAAVFATPVQAGIIPRRSPLRHPRRWSWATSTNQSGPQPNAAATLASGARSTRWPRRRRPRRASGARWTGAAGDLALGEFIARPSSRRQHRRTGGRRHVNGSQPRATPQRRPSRHSSNSARVACSAGPAASGKVAIVQARRRRWLPQLLAQLVLLHLAGGAQRNGVDEDHVVGRPPLGDRLRRTRSSRASVRRRAFHPPPAGALVPLRVPRRRCRPPSAPPGAPSRCSPGRSDRSTRRRT